MHDVSLCSNYVARVGGQRAACDRDFSLSILYLGSRDWIRDIGVCVLLESSC